MIANRLLLERRDRVVGVGEAVRQALLRNEGFPPRRVGVVYNGVPLDRFVGFEGKIPRWGLAFSYTEKIQFMMTALRSVISSLGNISAALNHVSVIGSSTTSR